MVFNLDEFLIAVSFALDFVELDLLGVPTNHGKRVAYIALNLAKEFNFSEEELHDIVALSILHDNGTSALLAKERPMDGSREALILSEGVRAHCIIGEDNIKEYPFFTDIKNVIKYHHEKYDGTGFFGLKGDEIPLMSEIIFLSDRVELEFVNIGLNYARRKDILKFLNGENGKSFSPRLIEAFCKIGESKKFWEGLKDENIIAALKDATPRLSINLNLAQVRNITKIFSKIIDSKSRFTLVHSQGLAEKAKAMGEYYKFPEDEKQKLLIAADLHDIGKLAISNDILDKPGKLTKEEFEQIKKHAKYTRMALQHISGFEEITEWAANHHEKLDGSGYPFGKKVQQLDFNSRLMGCLDIYQALIEERPYRTSMSHDSAIQILREMGESSLIDNSIVKDINKVFFENSL